MLGEGRGGIENSFAGYTECLLMQGHEVHSIIHPEAKIRGPLEKLNASIHTLKNYGSWDPIARYQLNKLLNTLSPSLILTHGNRPLGMIRDPLLMRKTIPVIHNYSFKKALKFNHLITITQDLQNKILIQNPNLKSVSIIPNMVRIPSLTPRSSNLKDPIVIGVLGRMVKKKGFEVFIGAIECLRNEGFSVRAVIAGQGEEENFLKKMVADRNLNDAIDFPGWMAQSEFFSQIELFCLPSRHEPFGMVLIEAFAHKVPVVSTRTEGPLEIGKNGDTLLFSSIDDAEMMAAKIKVLIENSELRNRLVNHAFEVVNSQYSMEAVSTKLNNTLENLLSHES